MAAGDMLTFMADDAFRYTDTYRKAVEWTPEKVAQKMAWLSAKVNGEEECDSALYAEYRAYEHALKYLAERTEPGVVFLGRDADKSHNPQAEAIDMEEQNDMLRERVQKLREDLALHKKSKVNMDLDLSKCRSDLNFAKNKLNNCQGVQYMLLATTAAFFFLTIILAFIK